MLNKKEIISIIVASLVLGFVFSLIETFSLFLWTTAMIFLVIIINLLAKKITAFHFDSEIELRLWEMKRYGIKKHKHFKHAFPAGAFFPIITTALSLGYIRWMAALVFDIKSKIYRAARRHGIYKFSEIPEFHIGLIAAAGIAANLLFAIIGYLINLPDFAKLNIYYAFFNTLPLSDLDGNKIFFANITLWAFLASVTLIGVLLAVFMF